MFEYMPMNIAGWGLEIVIYFFLIGTAAMTFAVAAGPATFGNVAAPFRNFEIPGAIATLVLLIIVVPLLIGDLSQPQRFLNPIIYFRWASPLSWGSVLLILFGLAVLGFLYGRYAERPGLQRISAIIGSLLALSMPLYTGLDLSVNQARELWANPTIPTLFVALSITSGAALVALIQLALRKFTEESARLIRFILAFSLAVTLVLFFGLVQMMVYGTEELQQAWAAINGEFTLQFWWLGLVVGVLIPLALAIGPMVLPQMEFAASPAMVTLTAVLGAIGAYTLREVIVYAGQLPQLYY